MNIQNLLKSLAPSRPANPQARKVELLMKDAQQQGGDELAISYHSRAALGELRQRPDVHPGVRGMVNAELPEDRAVELRERIDHSYYKHPAVLRKVVVMLTAQMETELP